MPCPGDVNNVSIVDNRGWALAMPSSLPMAVSGDALGVVVAPLVERPDFPVVDNGRLVVVRDGEGEFSGLASRLSNYELSQWRARDGDSREAGEV